MVNIKEEDFESFFNLLQESFPEIERRNYADQKKLLNKEEYNIVGYKNDKNEVIAFIAYWKFDKYYFIEHFAVKESLRGHKIGTELLKKFLEDAKKRIILEVEFPEDYISIKRIDFYNRIGFVLNDYDYLQPPLQKGMELFPLKIMSYINKLSQGEFENIRREIYKKVYKYDTNSVNC